jgi:hypothetical protein
VAEKSNAAYWRTGILVDVVLILVGVWMISRGWTDSGEVVVGVSVVGLAVSVVQLFRLRKQRPTKG